MVERKGKIRFLRHVTKGEAIGHVLRYVYDHARMPLMVTETSSDDDVSGRQRWMDDTIGAVRTLRSDGIPVIGYTWFPMFSLFRWECRLSTRPLDGYLIHLGLYDLERDADRRLRRTVTPMVDCYREHMALPMPPIPAPPIAVSLSLHDVSVR
jgi:beta-glucosidase/6-phospho-beta-glucosidase/beta-galactosidase